MLLHLHEHKVDIIINDSVNDNCGIFVFGGRPNNEVALIDDALFDLMRVIKNCGSLDPNWIALEVNVDTFQTIKMMVLLEPDPKIYLDGQDKATVYMECQDCNKVKEDVSYTYCPFVQEIDGEDREIRVCRDCYHERAMEV